MFVNKLDRERASFEQTLEQLKDRFGAGIAPLELPIGAEAEFRGVIDLLSDTAETYADGSPRGNEGPVPDDMAAEEHSVHDALVEGIVVADDDLMERYLADEKIDPSELGHALATGIDEATVFPVLCGSATKLIGVDRLARFIVEEGPEPHVTGDDGQTALFVFKTIVDPYVGHVNLFKVLQGVLRPDDTLVNGRTVHDERLHQITTMRGKEQEPAKELHAGDIGAVAKLADTTTGDVLAERGTDISVEPFAVPDPLLADRDPREVEERRGQARDRAAPPRRRGPGAARRPQRRDAPDAARGHGRDARVDRDRATGAQVRRRRRDRGRAGPLPRDDHRRGRGRGQGQEAERRARAVRDRVAAGRAHRARRRASSSSTRSSAA